MHRSTAHSARNHPPIRSILELLESRIVPADLSLSRGTWIGSSGEDRAAALAISPVDGSYLAAVEIAGAAGGAAQLLRLNDTLGNAPSQQISLGGTSVRDLAVSLGDGRVVAVGDFGIRVFAADLNGPAIWQQSGSFDRVAIGRDGTVATLQTGSDTLTIWSAAGTQLATQPLTGGDVRSADLAIHPDTNRVFVTGYTQATSELQVPWIRSFDRTDSTLNLVWKAWDFSASTVLNASLAADSRGVRIEWGTNGSLYFLGRMDGGNTVFARDPDTITTALGSRLVDPDSFTDTSAASGARTLTFFSQMNPDDGTLIRGQIIVTRLSAGGANSFTPASITADALGTVFIGGSSAATLQNRDSQTINGQTVGAYRLGEAAILSVSADFSTRRFWTALTANGDSDGSDGSIVGFAVNGSTVAMLGSINTPGVATVTGDWQPTPLGGKDIYFAAIANGSPITATITADTATRSITEGNSGTTRVIIPINRTGTTTVSSAVRYVIRGSGTNPVDASDFVGGFPSGSIVFPIGSSVQQLEFEIRADADIEADEAFEIVLSFAENARIATPILPGIIVNDDSGTSPPPVTPPTVPPVTPPVIPPTVPPVSPPVTPPIVPPTVPPATPPIVPPVIPARSASDQNRIADVAISTGLATDRRIELRDGTGANLGSRTLFSAEEAPGGVRAALADVNGDGVPDLIGVTGPGGVVRLRVQDGVTNAILRDLTAYDVGEQFLGGAFLAAADLDGDGRAEIALSPDQGGGARVILFRGDTGAIFTTFFVFPDDLAFRGGARVAFGDINGDSVPELVVSAGFQGGPRIAIFDGGYLRGIANGGESRSEFRKLLPDFFLFEPTLRDGAFVSIGDVDGDGRGDLIGGGGPNGGPRVRILSGASLLANDGPRELANFFSGDPTTRGGVRVIAKDIDADGKADLITGDGSQGTSRVRWYRSSELLAPSGDAGAPAEAQSDAPFGSLFGGVFLG